MTREQAYQEMVNGNKITHQYFMDYEYYQLVNNRIIAEDGVNHTSVFWSNADGNFRENGWEIKP